MFTSMVYDLFLFSLQTLTPQSMYKYRRIKKAHNQTRLKNNDVHNSLQST